MTLPPLVEIMISAGHRLQRLVNDLLTASCLEHGTLPLRVEPTPIRPLLDWARNGLGPVAAADIHVDCAADLCADADPDRLDQILVNLLANAIQHGAPPVVASTTSSADGATIEILVRDAGPGIAPDAARHLFEPFSPLATPTSRSTGLGLSIARTLARAMGGDLRYSNEQGSTFRLRLPRSADGAGAPSGDGGRGGRL